MYSKVINIAHELILQRGIRSITMNEIAAEAGMSKRTLYEIFSNKEDLLEKLLEVLYEEHRNTINTIIEGTQSCIIGLLNVLKHKLEEHKHKHEPGKEFFFSDLKKIYPKVAEKHTKYRDSYLVFMAKHLEKGVEQQTVRSDLNLKLASVLLIAQIEGLDNIKIIKQFNIAEIFTTIIVSFCRGISTNKGLVEIDRFINENQVFFEKI